MLFVKRSLVVAVCLVISACAGRSPNLITSTENGPDPATEGVVLYKLYGNSPGMIFGVGKGPTSLWHAFQEEKGQGHFYSFSRESRTEVFHVRANRYFLNFVSNGALVRVSEPIPMMAFSPQYDIPVAPFELKPGQVLYLGTLVVHGIRHDQVVGGPTPGISFQVIDETEQARAALLEAYPTLADKMETKLFQVLGADNTYAIPDEIEDESP